MIWYLLNKYWIEILRHFVSLQYLRSDVDIIRFYLETVINVLRWFSSERKILFEFLFFYLSFEEFQN